MSDVKLLMKSLREYKKPAIIGVLIILFEVFLEVSVPYIAGLAIDKGIQSSSDPKVLIIYGLVLIGLTLICFILGIVANIFVAKSACGFGKNLRSDLYKKLQEYSFKNIDKFSTPSIVTRITTDVQNIQNAYIMLIRVGVRAPIMLVLALILSFISSPIIGLIYIIMAIVLGTILIFISIKAHPFFEKGVTTYDDLNAVVQENLEGIRVVKSFNKEDYENSKFGKISTKIFNLMSNGEKVVSFQNPIVQLCIYSVMIALAFFCTRFIVIDNTMQVGTLSSSISYAWMILNVLIMLSMIFVQVIIAQTSIERTTEMLKEVSDLKNKENPITVVKDGSVEFKNVSFRYSEKSEKKVLDNINLKIESGQTVGILGGTGSSKSSFVNLIARLYDVSEGEVLVGGVNVKDYDLYSLRDKVSVVLQKNVLFSGTIKENLRWGNKNATDEEIIHAAKLAQADSFIEQFPDKYDTKIEEGGSNVSGGQKQRLCIARALLKSPKILILDDSTSAVDTKTDQLIRKAFKENIPNITKFIVAQRVSSVEDADVIIILNEGKIDGIGTHKELLKNNAIYKEVYESQNRMGGK